MQLRNANMPDVKCLCVLLALYFLHTSCLSGSEFMCRDPDTGKLHAVNTTWASTTFCGNYSCRIRKKNLSLTEYAPLRQFNVTNLQMFMDEDKNNTEQNNTSADSVREVRNKKEKINKDKLSDDDRYLTEEEIKTITQILHSLKKSDLDAIIEIYKLAQDIYKEINHSGMDKIDGTVNNGIDDPFYGVRIDHVHNRPSSYWYGPINSLAISDSKDEDMDKEGSNAIMTVAKGDLADINVNSPLHAHDFRRVLYYYPMSDFQRLTSYTHSPTAPILHPTPTCNKKKEEKSKGSSIKKTIIKDLRPAFYLPYPFSYIRRFNFTYPDIYYKYNFGNYAIDTRYNKNPFLRSYVPQIPVTTVYPTHRDIKKHKEETKKTKAEIKKTNVKEKKESDKKVVETKTNKENKQLAAWQTPPLSNDVIEDIRANVKDKMKILKLWRRNIKLERVGNVIDVEKIMRSKRHTLEVIYEPAPMMENQTSTEAPGARTVQEDWSRQNVLYELVVEKIICSVNDTTPGYFRHGNLSQPFPGCCPQRIDSR